VREGEIGNEKEIPSEGKHGCFLVSCWMTLSRAIDVRSKVDIVRTIAVGDLIAVGQVISVEV
jgi:hypothetical protein